MSAGVLDHGRSDRLASPRARAFARAQGLDLGHYTGTGPNGRIVRSDLDAVGARMEAAVPARPTGHVDIPNSVGRTLIARRLAQSMREAPHFFASVDCRADAVLALRNAWASRLSDQGPRLSVNDFVIHAAARALRDVPGVNVTFTDTAIRHHRQVHVAVAVAVDGGLVTPVVANADCKGVAEIAAEMRELVVMARAGTLPSGACAGGTFSVSSLGSLGVRSFTAVIDPPQAAILAVGAAEPRAIVQAGQLAVATMMTVTLSSDHRAIDGVLAVRWLAAFRQQFENPREEDVWTSIQPRV